MSKWTGESRGNALGYQIFIFALKYLGLNVAYFMLHFVVFYFVAFSGKAFRYTYLYFRKIQKYSSFRSFFSIYASYFRYGQTIIDKVVMLAGFDTRYQFDFDGREILEAMSSEKTGGILISAHVGNFEMAAKSLDHLGPQISVVTLDAEKADIKKVLVREKVDKGLNFIPVSQDLSHVFRIGKAIAERGIVCFTGDRFKPGDKTYEAELMGYKASFPAGPFDVAARLKVPIGFVFGMKASSRRYQFFCRTPQCEPGDGPQEILKEFIKLLEKMLRDYPIQWFNYYDFWDFQKK